MSARGRVLLLEHQPESPAGLLRPWAAERGLEAHVVPVADARNLPDRGRYAFIATLGSEASLATDPLPEWAEREREYLAAAVDAGVAVIGVCFGAQILASALGADVVRAAAPEVGWQAIEASEPELSGHWFQWHVDAFATPPGSEELARSPVAPQAFRHGRSLGLQFHAEVEPATITLWLYRFGSAMGLDPQARAAIAAATPALAAEAAVAARRLFDGFHAQAVA